MVRLTDRLDMTIAVDWDVKQQTKKSKHLANYVKETEFKFVHL